MEDKFQVLEKYIADKIEDCKSREQQLVAEERKDEANICRVKMNIYDIFRTLLSVSMQQAAKDGEEAVCRSFEEKAERIPQSWKASYEKAKEHNDIAKILIEEEKLAAAKDVMEYYHKLMEV